MPSTFLEVVAALKSERLYQDAQWGDNLDRTNNVSDYSIYMQNYLNKVHHAVNDKDKLENMRKVAAIAVKAMETFGAAQREGFPVCTECHEQGSELSPEQLDELIERRMREPLVPRNTYHRVVENLRTYAWNKDGVVYQHSFLDVRAFLVSDSGGHRLIDKVGNFYYIPAGWAVLAVEKHDSPVVVG